MTRSPSKKQTRSSPFPDNRTGLHHYDIYRFTWGTMSPLAFSGMIRDVMVWTTST